MSHDWLFTLRVPLHEWKASARTRLVLAVTAWDRPVPPDPQTGHHYIDVRARLVWTDVKTGKRRSRTIWKRGETWCGVNRWTSTDGEDAKELVLSLLSMKPGDTDEDYFAGWTEEQIAFAEEWGEDLSLIKEARYGAR